MIILCLYILVHDMANLNIYFCTKNQKYENENFINMANRLNAVWCRLFAHGM